MSETWETEEYRPPEIVALLGGIKRHNKKQVHPAGESTSSDVQDYDPEDGGDNGDGLARENKMGGLTLSQKIAFGLPNLALAAMYLPTSIHINKFFADTLLVKPGTLALATAIARAFDTLLDPFFGWLSDNTNTRWGRRKPYIAVGAPLNAFFYFLLFTPPASLSTNGAAVWFGIFFSLYLFMPMSLPHHAMGPELTLDYKERSSLYAWSEVFSLIGVITAAAAPGIMAQYISDSRTIFFYMSLTIGILLVSTYAIMLYVVKEPEQTVNDGNPLVPGLRRAWRNTPFRILVSASVVGSIAHHCSNLMFPFYISYVLHPMGDTLWLSVCLLTYFGASAISIPMWCWLAQHYDKRSVWLFGWLIHLPSSFAMFFLTEGASYSLITLTAVTGFSFGGSSYLYKAIQADAIDYDELKTTRRREGQYITFWALIPKLVAIPSASIPLVILEGAGYVANRHPQPENVVMAIRIMTTLLPCVFSAVALLFAFQYPITREKNREVLALIHQRRQAIKNQTPLPDDTDPITGKRLTQTSGGLSVLTAQFCWYLDYFSKDELKLLLRNGQNALIWSVLLSIYATIALLVAAIALIWLGGTALKVVGVMGCSFGLAILIFHYMRLRAARQFDQEKLHTFRKGHREYFDVLT